MESESKERCYLQLRYYLLFKCFAFLSDVYMVKTLHICVQSGGGGYKESKASLGLLIRFVFVIFPEHCKARCGMLHLGYFGSRHWEE